MFFNFIVGFLIPWIFGIFVYFKLPKMVLIMAPFGSVISFVFNDWGFQYHFWEFTPILDEKSYAAIPFNVGLFPVLAIYFVYFIMKKGHPIIIFLLITLGTTLLEYTFVLIDRIEYGNGWNVFFTFLSYSLAYLFVYLFYGIVRYQKMLE